MATVFLSYRSKDHERGKAIAEGLRELGHIVLTGSDISPGSSYTGNLVDFFSKADMAVFIVSEDSLNSEWMGNEIGIASATRENKRAFSVIPVVFDRHDLTGPLASYQAIFASDEHLQDAILKLAVAADRSFGDRIISDAENKETQKRIEENAASFITETFDFLRVREKSNKFIANLCYLGGLVALIAGVVIGIDYTRTSASVMPTVSISWATVLFLSVRGLVVIGLLVGISKYAFNLGKAFMNEGLRNSDRYHAISFGSFYLKAFGEKATWDQLKEVFQTWNIDSASAFTKLESSDYDPKFLEAVVAVAQAVGANKEKKEEHKKER